MLDHVPKPAKPRYVTAKKRAIAQCSCTIAVPTCKYTVERVQAMSTVRQLCKQTKGIHVLYYTTVKVECFNIINIIIITCVLLLIL